MDFPPRLIEAIRSARHVAVLTGAGISAESGIPTFREAQTGLWSKYRPEDLATRDAFRRNPQLVWDWYQWRRELVNESAPNHAHTALAQLEKIVPSFTLITQNVDGLHDQAGSSNILELHGNIMRMKCFENDHPVDNWNSQSVPPKCPVCSSYLRPDVVWFGEYLPRRILKGAISASQECDVFLSIGTSAFVEPAASLPWLALQNHALLVEINTKPTPLTKSADYVFEGLAGETLPKLIEDIQNEVAQK
jgi:NAD-dependent deacetylase